MQEVISAALAPLTHEVGWHGLAYGMLFYKLITRLLTNLITRALGESAESPTRSRA